MSIVDFERLTDSEPASFPVVPSAPMANGDSIPTAFDPVQLRGGRLARLRAMMAEQGYAAVVLFDPASFTRVLIERSEGTDWWHRLSGSASSVRMAVE